MHDDVESVFNRALNPWRCKCVIANGDDFVLARNFRDRVEVDQLQQRIAGCFDPNHARVWFDCALEIRSIGQIDVAKIKIRRATAHFVEQPECAAVKIVTHNDMRSAFQQFKHGRHCGEAGRESEPSRPAFQIGDAFFIREPRGINRARVIVAFMLPGAFLHVGRCRIDRRHHRASGRIGLLPRVDRARGKFVFLFHVSSI